MYGSGATVTSQIDKLVAELRTIQEYSEVPLLLGAYTSAGERSHGIESHRPTQLNRPTEEKARYHQSTGDPD